MKAIVVTSATLVVAVGIVVAGYLVGECAGKIAAAKSVSKYEDGVRLDYKKVSPDAYKAMLGMEGFVRQSGVEKSLLELIRIRASQLNSCAHCLDMHIRDAGASGESVERMDAVVNWRSSKLFSKREKAALAWAEALTLVAQNPVSDELFGATREYFSEEELVAITMATISINGWNRLNVGFLSSPDSCPVE